MSRLGNDSLADVLGGRRLTDDVLRCILTQIQEVTHTRTIEPSLLMWPEELPDLAGCECILILYEGVECLDGHWSTAHYKDGLVKVYDSLCRTSLSRNECLALDKLFGDYRLEFPRMKSIQDNNIDCGVFAAAYAIEASLGGNPATAVFDKGCMRPFLHQLLLSNELQPFPKSASLHIHPVPSHLIPPSEANSHITDQSYTVNNTPGVATLCQVSYENVTTIYWNLTFLNPFFELLNNYGSYRVFINHDTSDQSDTAFLQLCCLKPRKSKSKTYSLLQWKPGQSHCFIFNFCGRTKQRDAYVVEKKTVTLRLLTPKPIKMISMKPNVCHNIEERTLKLCIAVATDFVLGHEPKNKEFSINRASQHLSHVMARDVLVPFPVKSSLESSLTPHTQLSTPDLTPAIQVETDDLGTYSPACSNCGAMFFDGEVAVKGIPQTQCCQKGKVYLPPLLECPPYIKSLLLDSSEEALHFRANIRRYNSALAFGSINAHVVNLGAGHPAYIVEGQIYCNAYSSFPLAGDQPRQNQLWFLETNEGSRYRLEQHDYLREFIIMQLTDELHQVNPFAQAYKSVSGFLSERNAARCQVAFAADMAKLLAANPGVCSHPTGTEVAAIYTHTGSIRGADFTVSSSRDGSKQRLSTSNPLADPLLFPLLFPGGDMGFVFNTPGQREEGQRVNITRREFYVYRIAERRQFCTLMFSGRLFQQYIVFCCLRYEDDRLDWIRRNQRTVLVDSYKGLLDRVTRVAGSSAAQVGRVTFLPSSFYGSHRHRFQKYCDSLAAIRVFGRYDLFVTVTTNPSWPEIKNVLAPGQQNADRVDIGCRVFRTKLKRLLNFIEEKKPLGNVLHWSYVIEFQKRGLPHAHMVLTMVRDDRIDTADAIDKVISAEIPQDDPVMKDLVLNYMIHKPCQNKPNAPCKRDGKCKAYYPKAYRDVTEYAGSDKRPEYKRRPGVSVLLPDGQMVDNSNVVPYCKPLLKFMASHVNVEAYQPAMGVRYLHKYLSKGSQLEHVSFVVAEDGHPVLADLDEIQLFQNARYLSCYEAFWLLHGFPMFGSSHSVFRLACHLPDEQSVYFHVGEEDEAERRAAMKKTHLTAFFELNRVDAAARNLTYLEIPHCYVYHTDTMSWKPREKRGLKIISRIYDVPPRISELFHLRILLHHKKGATSFEDVRTVNETVYDTFKEACINLRLVESDWHYMACLREAANLLLPSALRKLFVHIVIWCNPINVPSLYNNFIKYMSQDYELRTNSCTRARHWANSYLSKLFHQMNSDPQSYGLDLQYDEEESFFCHESEVQHDNEEVYTLTGQQDMFFKKVKACLAGVTNVKGSRAFFLDGPAGTGKTYVLNAVLKEASKVGSPITMAWSGLAANLLKGGGTVHSTLRLGFNLDVNTTVGLKIQSTQAANMRESPLILWDEVSMANKYAVKALDDFLRLIMNEPNIAFGGKVIVFSGDFRQILPVVPKQKASDFVVTQLRIWKDIQHEKLTENLRVLQEEKTFATLLLAIGNGTTEMIPGCVIPGAVTLPSQCILQDVKEMVKEVIVENGGVILTPTNEEVRKINEIATNMLGLKTTTYFSVDTSNTEGSSTFGFPVEILNSMNPSGLPPHKLDLAIGMPVMLLRNIDVKDGLCNGTRMIVKELKKDVILCTKTLLSGNKTDIFIFRQRMMSGEEDFSFSRLQFPIKPAYAITIHKSQGQTLDWVGLYLSRPVFEHGMLYVALSRAKSSKKLRIVVLNTKKQGKNLVKGKVLTLNVVNNDVLGQFR